MALVEMYIRIVITKNMWKRLAANNLPTNSLDNSFMTLSTAQTV